MIIAIIIAIVVTVILCFLANLIISKMPIPSEFVWLVWLIVILLIVLVWWRVIAPYVGPLP